MQTIGSSLFKDKRITLFWLRWLLITALSYLMLFHTGRLELSLQASSIIFLYILSNLMLIALPARFFERAWVDMALITGDSLLITTAMTLTGLAGNYLLLFYFLIILLTTLGRGSGAVLANGLVMVGVYLMVLLKTQGTDILQTSGFLLHLPFLLICTVFYAVLVDREYSKQRQIQEQMKLAEVSQNALRAEVQAQECARKQVEELMLTMRHQTLHDSLTKLPNRTLLMDRLQQAILIARREQKRFAVFMMDLDQFKEFNETLGHHQGDVLLQEIASRLCEGLREADTIARLGGDEFAMLLLGVEDPAAVTRVARRIMEALEKPFMISGFTLRVLASIGIVLFPEDGADANTLMCRVDRAMYAAKQSKGGFVFYSSVQDRNNLDRMVLAADLHQALEHEELILHYQPKVDFKTGHIRGVEALARWQHPRDGLLFPDIFVPLAEQLGLMKSLTSWVRNTALSQCGEWRAKGLDLSVAINISVSSLQDSSFADRIVKMLKVYNVAPEWLELEITESAMMQKPECTQKALTKLSAIGVKLSIDDFGTGYSSLAYLAKLPISSIKIDKSFVRNMRENTTDALIVRTVIQLSHSLGIKVVAEGIEDQPTWDSLASLGCDMGQGYFISRPIPAEELKTWLNESPWGLGKKDKDSIQTRKA